MKLFLGSPVTDTHSIGALCDLSGTPSAGRSTFDTDTSHGLGPGRLVPFIGDAQKRRKALEGDELFARQHVFASAQVGKRATVRQLMHRSVPQGLRR